MRGREGERERESETHLADLARRVEEALEDVLQDDARPERDAHRLDGVEHRVDDMRRSCRAAGAGQPEHAGREGGEEGEEGRTLEDVGPDEVE